MISLYVPHQSRQIALNVFDPFTHGDRVKIFHWVGMTGQLVVEGAIEQANISAVQDQVRGSPFTDLAAILQSP